jgi:hypothetical protein
MENLQIGDWILFRTKKKDVQGIVSKVNCKTFLVRIQVAGKYVHILRRNSELIEILG